MKKISNGLAGLVFSSALSIGATQMSQAGFTEERVTTNNYDQTSPSIFDDKMVWQDQRNGSSDIYMWDEANGETPLITNLAESQFPKISYGNVVYQDNRNGNWDVYIWNQFNGETAIGSTNYQELRPDIDGVNVVWRESTGTGDHIIIWNPVTGTTQPDGRPELGDPKIYGNRAVWHNRQFGEWYIRQGSGNTEETFYSSPNPLLNPDIYESKVVFSDNGRIRLKDLLTNQSHPVSDIIGSAYNPNIFEETVVWEDNRFGNWDIFMWSPELGEVQVTNNINDQRYPQIHGETIVWQDNRNGNWDIYKTIIPEPSSLVGLLGIGLLAGRRRN